ncbi:DUF3618 domain-containing protein [Wenjunlia tyrosinilytica]|jgi:hypothetical protein|uniref:DUF3618 domain-containing protein n=1 Tax=Wenjunlia tyrosinilytica TaxID=1544741 RepID=A0A918DYB3_9ACTN|nr:DUF3618 domain-containing protein [Wenjunlia tyrosinilytica]GGO90219.1 hypothetical protein GCM10012280_35240 [Wenjunlia tyrosinilytica]
MTGASQPHEAKPTVEELREQVNVTRTELGRTVEALAAKTDIKARAQVKATEMREQMQHRAAHAKDRVQGQTAHVLHLAQDRTPEPVQERTGQVAQVAHRNRTVLIVGGAAVATAALVLFRTRGRLYRARGSWRGR